MTYLKKKFDLPPEELRSNLLNLLWQQLKVDIDMSRLGDREYVASLSPEQRNSLKSISFYKDGTVSRADRITVLDVVAKAADIGGAKKAEAEDKKFRSKPITIKTVSPSSPASKKNAPSGNSGENNEAPSVPPPLPESAPQDGIEKIVRSIGKGAKTR